MRDQGGGVLFSPPIDRKKPTVKLIGKEEGNEMARKRPGCVGESNYSNGSAKFTGAVLQAGIGRLKGGSLLPNNSSNGGRHHHEELNGERCSSVSKVPEEALLPQWGRGKRSRGSRPDKHAPSSPSQEPSAHLPGKKHLLSGLSSSKPRNQGPAKPLSSNFNAPDRLVSRKSTMVKAANGPDQTSGFDSARRLPNGKERALSFQKRSVDSSFGIRQQQRSEGSDMAMAYGASNCGETVMGFHRTANGASILCDGNGLDCSKPKVEWPRISLTLSRKEKEEDFFILKGSKLPQRPRKRLKVVEKALLFCSPGNWLSDISRGRYDVREKKNTKKKPRGLKAMDSAESESD